MCIIFTHSAQFLNGRTSILVIFVNKGLFLAIFPNLWIHEHKHTYTYMYIDTHMHVHTSTHTYRYTNMLANIRTSPAAPILSLVLCISDEMINGCTTAMLPSKELPLSAYASRANSTSCVHWKINIVTQLSV